MTDAGEELVAVPRSLLGAACAAIRGKRNAPNALSQLNRYAVRGAALAKPAAGGGVRESAIAYFAAIDSKPELDCWDTDTGEEEPGAEKFSSDWAWLDYHDKVNAARFKLRAALSSPASSSPAEAEALQAGVNAVRKEAERLFDERIATEASRSDLIRRLVIPMVHDRSREPGDAWHQAEEALISLCASDLTEIEEMLAAGQGEDDGPQILPDFEKHQSTAAKVEACLHLLEVRRDVIAALSPAPAQAGSFVASASADRQQRLDVAFRESMDIAPLSDSKPALADAPSNGSAPAGEERE